LYAPEPFGNGSYVVKPKNYTHSHKYTFYSKIIADGNATEYFGPYELHVGCTSDATFHDNPYLETYKLLKDGDS